MGGALSRASPHVDALDVDAAVLHRFDAGDLDQLARGEVPMRSGHALAGAQVAPGRVGDFHPRFFSGGARAGTIGRCDPSRGCLT